jgi:hypothetical protein
LSLSSALFVFRQYIFNVGPDDRGAEIFARTQLLIHSPRSVEVLSFEPDKTQPISGVYRLHYDVKGLQGVFSLYYDGATQKFSASKPLKDNYLGSYKLGPESDSSAPKLTAH